jgi:two-component system, OmpR family, phosphate regulon sensor histidine kinase PhoR
MRERRILWKIFPSYLVVTVLALAAAVWFSAHTTEELFRSEVEGDLAERGHLIEREVLDLVRRGDLAGLESLCRERGARGKMRITVILPDGRVGADSDEDPATMGNHRGRVEVAEALAGRVGSAVHSSQTLRRDMMYVALPLSEGGAVRGVLRLSVPLLYVGETLRPFLIHIVVGGSVIAALAAALALAIARRLAAPLEELRNGAEGFAVGDLSKRLPRSSIAEIDRVAGAMNGMAAELDRRIRTIISQRNELEAILSSMREGVVAVDSGQRILRVNGAAASMLGIAGEEVDQKTILEAIPNPTLHDLIGRIVAADEPVEGEIVFDGEGERFVLAHGAALRDSRGVRTGAVVVLNDVTRIRRLENLRREFVANVSHELRTPITSIRGFVETLQEGAFESPGEASRFLAIIAKQVEHLSAVVEDLLLLSRLDEGDPTSVPREERRVRDILESAVEVCATKSAQKGVEVIIECDPELRALCSPPLLEGAVVNLVDNAIKFSESGKKATVAARAGPGELVIEVTDAGCGVGPEDLPRLFERFYRVDKARSRKLGGTGLGLAIVKHIAKVHGGTVSAESALGKGSRFAIRLPRTETGPEPRSTP